MTHHDKANELRAQYVRDDAQAPTVQGELLRAIDALRADAGSPDPAGRWDENDEILAGFIGDILLGSAVFRVDEQQEIRECLARIGGPNPDGDGLPYQRLEARIVDWAELHPEPVPHHPNAALQR